MQESIANCETGYYDIMLIGLTGQGKSTTTDKLLVANPVGCDYSSELMPTDVTTDKQNKQLNIGDITMWMTSTNDFEKEKTRMKSLVYSRTTEHPQDTINKVRKSEGNDSTRTIGCELFSNETSKIRVLDVPGFFDEDFLTSPNGAQQVSILDSSSNTTNNNLVTMRKIIRIQKVMGMKFKRILYFLPVRGPLERANGILQQELQAMTHYFGISFLRKLVLVATNPPVVSELAIPEDRAFPPDARTETLKYVHKALKKVFPNEASFPEMSLIYISLNETCESIHKKILDAHIQDEDLRLELNPEVCGNCGKRVGVIKGERLTCYLNVSQEIEVPYEESTCHPKIVPNYKIKHRFAEFFARLFTLGRVKSLANYFLLEEICAGCGQNPGNPGCMRVGDTYTYKRETIRVDHRCDTESIIQEETSEEETSEQDNPIAGPQ